MSLADRIRKRVEESLEQLEQLEQVARERDDVNIVVAVNTQHRSSVAVATARSGSARPAGPAGAATGDDAGTSGATDEKEVTDE